MADSMTKETLFVVGAEVAVFGPHDRFVKFGTIAKIYKNGNFVIDGDTQQFKPFGNNYATATGDYYEHPYARVLTPEVRARARQIDLRHRWRAAIHRLERIQVDGGGAIDEADIQMLESILAKMQARSKAA